VLRSPIADALVTLLGHGAHVVQSAVVYKQPRSEIVQFGLHQDAAYLTTEPQSLALAFVALDDADAENGGLVVVPGSHQFGLGERLRLGPSGFERAAGRAHRVDPRSAVLLPLKRGDVAFLDGLTYHASGPNRSDRRRRALIAHAAGAAARMHASCWVQEPASGFATLGDDTIDPR
jgi:phytanoyl-CoA hydroxylase